MDTILADANVQLLYVLMQWFTRSTTVRYY